MADQWPGRRSAAREGSGSVRIGCLWVTSRARAGAAIQAGPAWNAVRRSTGRRYASTAASSPARPRCASRSSSSSSGYGRDVAFRESTVTVHHDRGRVNRRP
jgi:hypothetical protein